MCIRDSYARVYDGIYDSIVNGKEQVIQPWQTILQMEMLETGVKAVSYTHLIMMI